jgi:hypothetical protein
MPNPFEIVLAFLDRHETEVEGRALVELPEDIRVKLRDLARGGLPAAERTGLFELLSRNPGWVACLADEVKALRSDAGPGEKKR